jgi:hypothetical protein
MSGTDRASISRRKGRQFALLCVGVCVVFSLAPSTDFDLDGSCDSFATDGCMMNATAPMLGLPALLFRKPEPHRVQPHQPFSAPIPRPPIL